MNRFLEIDSGAWSGLEETAGTSSAKHHVGAVCLILCLSLSLHMHAYLHSNRWGFSVWHWMFKNWI